MTPIVSIIMGSTSDLPVMEKAAKFLDDMDVPFEMNALSAHRTPAEVESFARNAKARGIRVIIAGAGMAAALPGVIASSTSKVMIPRAVIIKKTSLSKEFQPQYTPSAPGEQPESAADSNFFRKTKI